MPTLKQCHGIKDLVFVPHQDDDLLFMNPDIAATIDAGGCVQVVYLTAAERGEGMKYMLGRARGVRAAYALLAGKPDHWSRSVARYGGRHQFRFVLKNDPRIALLHFRLGDPWLGGTGWGDLTPLSRVESVPGAVAFALGPYQESYDRHALVAAIADIIRDYGATTIRHMDDTIAIPYTKLCWRCMGNDHPDHIASARLVRDAMAIAPGNYAEVGYVDYPTQERPPNLSAREIAEKTRVFHRYAQDDYRYCRNPALCKEPLGPAASWVARSYYIERHSTPPALIPDGDGGFLLFTVGETSCAADVYDSRGKAWASLGGRFIGRLTAFRFPSGKSIGLLARSGTGRLWLNIRGPGRKWAGWKPFEGSRIVGRPVVAARIDGVSVIAMGNDGVFRHARLDAASQGGADSWRPLPPLADALADAAAARDASDRLVVFAADRLGRLWFTVQADGSPGLWRPWSRVAGVSTNGGLAADSRKGRVDLYARDEHNGHLLLLRQTAAKAAGLSWAKPMDLGVAYVGTPAISADRHGNPAVVVQGEMRGPLWLVENGHATRLDGSVESNPASCDVAGTLHVVGRGDTAGQIYRIWTRSRDAWQARVLSSTPSMAGGMSISLDSGISQPRP